MLIVLLVVLMLFNARTLILVEPKGMPRVSTESPIVNASIGKAACPIVQLLETINELRTMLM